MPIWHGSPLQRWKGRGKRGFDGQLLSTPRASGVGGVGIGLSTGRVQTHLGAPGGCQETGSAWGPATFHRVRRKDAQSRILGNGGEKPHACQVRLCSQGTGEPAVVFQAEEVCEALREMGVVQARAGGWWRR